MGFLASFAVELAQADLGPLSDAEAAAAARHVADQARGAALVTRAGIAAGAAATWVAAAVVAGRPWPALDGPRRRRCAARLGRSTLPLVGEFVRLVRSLEVAHAYGAARPAGS
ncbi:MAG: hypothetical protein U0R70_17120 [Solirubrobacteraceae bacterium]